MILGRHWVWKLGIGAGAGGAFGARWISSQGGRRFSWAENNPSFDASEIQVTGKDIGKVIKSEAYGRFGEACQLDRGTTETWERVRIGGGLVRERALVAEVTGRYQQGTAAAAKEL
jgi:hypothetical protein